MARRAAEDSGALLPRWLRKAAAYSVLALVAGGVLWLVLAVLTPVALVVAALATALLVAALASPLNELLRRLRAPRALAALVSVLVLLGIPVLVGLFVYGRIGDTQLDGLATALTLAVDDIRRWLVEGPLGLDPQQVENVRDTALARVSELAPSPVAGATTALRLLGALVLVVFAVFFLLKDGDRMWAWVLSWTPRRHHRRTAVAGEEAWATLRRYVLGTVVVAAVDAIGVGVALVLLGVPLWLSLALLTFLGAFVPVLGATVAGGAAVLVTLVSEGGRDALILLGAVILVQQVEGNLLQPLIMGRAVSLHPLVVVVAVTCGYLLLGVAGALFAVPVVAVSYRVAVRLRDLPSSAEPAAETAA